MRGRIKQLRRQFEQRSGNVIEENEKLKEIIANVENDYIRAIDSKNTLLREISKIVDKHDGKFFKSAGSIIGDLKELLNNTGGIQYDK